MFFEVFFCYVDRQSQVFTSVNACFSHHFFVLIICSLFASNFIYRYDLVDLTRQALAKYANELFLKVIEDYQRQDAHGVAFHSQKFLNLVEDMDTLLACHEGFLLGPWLESAKQLAQDKEQKRQVWRLSVTVQSVLEFFGNLTSAK